MKVEAAQSLETLINYICPKNSNKNGQTSLMNPLIFVIVIASFLCSSLIIYRYFRNSNLIFIIATINLSLFGLTIFLLPTDIYQTNIHASNDLLSNSTSLYSKLQLANKTISATSDLFSMVDSNYSYNSGHSTLIKLSWYLIYWSQFILCWLVLPILISYISLKYLIDESNYFEKVKLSILSNIKFYLLSLLVLIIGLIYLFLATNHSIKQTKSLIISLSHIYSLSYTLILLFNGLYMVPRDFYLASIFKNSVASMYNADSEINFSSNNNNGNSNRNNNNNNNSKYIELSKINEEINDCQLNIIDQANRILKSKELRNGDILFNKLLLNCQLEVRQVLQDFDLWRQLEMSLNFDDNSGITNLKDLNNCYNKFINSLFNYHYYQFENERCIHNLAQINNESYGFYFKKVCCLLGFMLTSFLSFLIITLEIIPLSIIRVWLFRWFNSSVLFYLDLLLLSYNLLTSLYAMSKFKFNNFHLIPNGNSNPKNVLYYSLYSSRLLFPICFNLITILPHLNIHTSTKNNINNNNENKSVFEQILYKDLLVIPIISYLNLYLPIIFGVVITLNHKFDLKQKVLIKLLGKETYYQIFGLMFYEPDSMDDENNLITEDYDYSLQDGRYLFERAVTNSGNGNNNNNNSFMNPDSIPLNDRIMVNNSNIHLDNIESNTYNTNNNTHNNKKKNVIINQNNTTSNYM